VGEQGQWVLQGQEDSHSGEAGRSPEGGGEGPPEVVVVRSPEAEHTEGRNLEGRNLEGRNLEGITREG